MSAIETEKVENSQPQETPCHEVENVKRGVGERDTRIDENTTVKGLNPEVVVQREDSGHKG